MSVAIGYYSIVLVNSDEPTCFLFGLILVNKIVHACEQDMSKIKYIISSLTFIDGLDVHFRWAATLQDLPTYMWGLSWPRKFPSWIQPEPVPNTELFENVVFWVERYLIKDIRIWLLI